MPGQCAVDELVGVGVEWGDVSRRPEDPGTLREDVGILGFEEQCPARGVGCGLVLASLELFFGHLDGPTAVAGLGVELSDEIGDG